MIRRFAAVVTLALLVATGCGRGEDPSLDALPTPDGAQTTAAPEPLEGASCEQQSGGDRDAAMYLTDVQIYAREGYDRIVFEFEPQEGQDASVVPFFQVEPTEPPLREAGSGREVEVDGDAYLEITLWATGVEIRPDGPHAHYTGPRTHRPEATEVIRQLRESGDFENTMTWHVGMNRAACFATSTTGGPTQLFVDIETAER